MYNRGVKKSLSTKQNLSAISPLDGRYGGLVGKLSKYFSEYALIKYRLKAEVYYLLFLCKKVVGKKINSTQEKKLLSIISNFNEDEALRVKEIEQEIHHDIKAVEYYLREKLKKLNLDIEEYIHFGLTSEDINSIAYSLSIKEARDEVILPHLKELVKQIALMSDKYKLLPMLARTHGQPAVPTTLGKELIVFAIRLNKELKVLTNHTLEAKLSGAVGNFNAHKAAHPSVNWIKTSAEFIKSLGLLPNHFTTQILQADSYIKIFQSLMLVNSIIIGFTQDMWRYISDDYFLQMVDKKRVGSSTMPQKVNPIDFENCEGNLGVANTLLAHFTVKLPISRLQRDLSDSTVKRNIGSAFAYSLLGFISCLKGLKKMTPNIALLKKDLINHWEIIGEGLQTILRSSGDKNAYEKLKSFSRGKKMSESSIKDFIQSLDIDNKAKRKLQQLSPLNYIGLAVKIVEIGLADLK